LILELQESKTILDSEPWLQPYKHGHILELDFYSDKGSHH
jgi:hypothetical protein